jgi:tetratricopeptide (TPR) repeat protein
MVVAYHGRGITRMSKNDLDAAIADFNRALELDPNLANTYMNRGLALLLQGKEAETEKDFERCLMLKPSVKDELEQRKKLARVVLTLTSMFLLRVAGFV